MDLVYEPDDGPRDSQSSFFKLFNKSHFEGKWIIRRKPCLERYSFDEFFNQKFMPIDHLISKVLGNTATLILIFIATDSGLSATRCAES